MTSSHFFEQLMISQVESFHQKKNFNFLMTSSSFFEQLEVSKVKSFRQKIFGRIFDDVFPIFWITWGLQICQKILRTYFLMMSFHFFKQLVVTKVKSLRLKKPDVRIFWWSLPFLLNNLRSQKSNLFDRFFLMYFWWYIPTSLLIIVSCWFSCPWSTWYLLKISTFLL